jgi:MFS family permease
MPRSAPRPHNPMPESRYEVLVLFTGAMVGSSLFITSTGAILPFLKSAFHLHQTQAGLVLSVQIIGSVLMSSVAGMLTDRFGDKAVVLWSGLFMGIALIAAGAVHNFTWVLFWLLLYGFGFASVTPSGSHAIVYFFKKEERGLAMGIRQCGVPIAGFIGSILLPAVAARFMYNWALVAAGIATIATCLFASSLYREPEALEGEQVSLKFLLAEMVAMARNVRLILVTLTSMTLGSTQFAIIAFLTLSVVDQTHAALAVAVGTYTLSQFAAIGGRIFWGWSADKLFGNSRSLPLVIICAVSAGLCVAWSAVTPFISIVVVGVLAALLGFAAEGWFGLAVLALAEIGGEEHAGCALGVSLTWIFVAATIAPIVFGALAEAQGFPFAWRSLALLQCLGIIPALLATVYARRLAALASARP